MINRSGLVLDYNAFVARIGMRKVHKVRKIFSITTIGYNQMRKVISASRIKQGNLILPRFAGKMLADVKMIDPPTSALQHGDDIHISESKLVLTLNQKAVQSHLSATYNMNRILQGTASAVLQMDPGYGKTYLAMGLIRQIKKKTFIIVPNTYLLRQWVCALSSAFPQNNIGVFYGKKKTDGDIIVSIVNSAIKYDFQNIGFVIYDEVHMYCSKRFSDVFRVAQAAQCIGLTATPNERIDKFDPVARWYLGELIYANTVDGWNDADVCFTSKVTALRYNGPDEFTETITSRMGVVSVPLMINQLESDPHRNRLIVTCAFNLYNQGLNVFVFSDRRNHLHTLAEIMVGMNVEFSAPELKINHVCELMGGSTDEHIEKAKTKGRIIMTTFQYSGTGVSINKMNAIIMATPRRSNMKQILGRIFRLTSDSNICRHIVDLIDNRTCLKSQYGARKKIYSTLRAPIKKITIDWGSCEQMLKIDL